MFLFDTGEDVQRRYIRSKLGLNRELYIFITHMHGDHIIGLPGLLFMMSLLGRKREINITGPPGIINYIISQRNSIGLMPRFDIRLQETSQNYSINIGTIKIEAFPVKHSIPSWGYSLIYQKPMGRFYPERALNLGVPKGKLWGELQAGNSVVVNGHKIIPEQVCDPPPRPLKISYTGDTIFTEDIIPYLKDSDILISESMYSEKQRSLAKERFHMTARDAAYLARDANVKLLVLTHISPRYDNPHILLEEARAVFENTVLAHDLMRIKLSYNEIKIFD